MNINAFSVISKRVFTVFSKQLAYDDSLIKWVYKYIIQYTMTVSK